MTADVQPGAWGIEPGFEDATGTWQDAEPGTIRAIAEVIGAKPGSLPPPSPVRIVRAGTRVRLGPGEVALEDGGSVQTTGALPPEVPPGYHHFTPRSGTDGALIVSPGKCFLPSGLKTWGWALQLHSARSRRSWGIGDLNDLRALARWSRSSGAGMAMLNPLHAPNPSSEPAASPYSPTTRCWRNPLYVSIDDVPGAAGAGSVLEDLRAQARRLNDDRRIDRAAVQRLKLGALEWLWQKRGHDGSFHRYRNQMGTSLDRYATYVTLAELHGSNWKSWPVEFRQPDSAAVSRFRDDHRDRIDFHKWIQWLLDEQLRRAAREIDLVHDLAIGVVPCGADAWAWQDVFAEDVKVGAPPDEFNRLGQDWGVLAFDPWKLRAAAYAPFIEVIRSAMRAGAGVRIDHVMGLFRLYWIPPCGDPRTGAYVRYPAHDLLDIVALESYRAGGYVIGEDLGTVEPQVPAEMARRNILSCRILWFEDDDPASYPELALAAVTNHDLPTIAGMWTGSDLETQKELGMSPDEAADARVKLRAQRLTGLDDDAPVDDVVQRLYAALARAPSALLAATLEDALGVADRPNYPGTTSERNWSVALPLSIEEMTQEVRITNLARHLTSKRPRLTSDRARSTRSRGGNEPRHLEVLSGPAPEEEDAGPEQQHGQ